VSVRQQVLVLGWLMSLNAVTVAILRKLIFLKMAVFWDVYWDLAPCSLVEAYRRFRGACYPDDGGSKHLLNSENFYQSTGRNNTEEAIFILAAVTT
jgi:hypothetical protein